MKLLTFAVLFVCYLVSVAAVQELTAATAVLFAAVQVPAADGIGGLRHNNLRCCGGGFRSADVPRQRRAAGKGG